MTRALAVAITLAALLSHGTARAAAINIIAAQVSPGGNVYTLTIETTLPVAAIGINVPVGTTFVINNANVAPFGSGSSLSDAATPGLLSLNLNPLTCVGVLCTPFATTTAPTVIGTFTAPNGFNNLNPLITPDDDSVGGTVFDPYLVPYDPSLWTISTPEPNTAALFAATFLSLVLSRRRRRAGPSSDRTA